MAATPSEQWIEDLSSEITTRIKKDMLLGNRKLLFFDGELVNDLCGDEKPARQDAHVLRRVVNGYIREFIHQTEMGIVDVNISSPGATGDFAPWSPFDNNRAFGIFHTQALIQKMADMGLSKVQIIALCKVVINDTVVAFKERYEKSFSDTPCASVAKDMQSLERVVDRCIPASGPEVE